MAAYTAIVKIFGEKVKKPKRGVLAAEKAIQTEELAYEGADFVAGDM